MRKKNSKFAFLFCLPIVAFLTLAIFLVSGISSGLALAVGGNGGGLFVGSSSTTTIDNGTTYSDCSAINGGGVYIADGGKLTINNGTISGNTATSGNGHNIYNAGTFTMTGGTVGTSGSSQTGYGIFNTGTMNLFGGTIHDSIYSSTSFSTKMSATINGTITLGDSATITVEDYAGTTPTYNIQISSSRANGTILTFKGSETKPDVSKISVIGYDLTSKECEVVQGSSSTEWNVVLDKKNVLISFDPQGTDQNNFLGIDGTFETYSEGDTLGFTNQLGTGGSFGVSSDKAFSGTKSLKIVGGSSSNSRVFLYCSGEKDSSYVFEAMIYSESSNNSLSIELNGGDYSWNGGGSSKTNAGSWERVVVETGVLTSNTTMYFFINVNVGQTVYVDQISVRKADSCDGGLLKNVKYGETDSTLPVPEMEDAVFDGWFAEFDGVDDFINFGREYMFTDKISVHLSAYSENWANVANQRLISCTEGGGWNIEGNNGKIQFACYDSGIGYRLATSSTTWSGLSAGWHTFDMIFDGTYLHGYVDGTEIATSPAFTSGAIGYNTTNSIFVGAEPGTSPTSPYDCYFAGKIGNVVIQHSSELFSSSNVSTWTTPLQNVTLYAKWEYPAVFSNFDLNLSFGKNRTNEYWSSTDTTGQGESVFVSENTTVYSGPYIIGFHNLMSNGEKYRIYFKAKASSLVTTSAIFEAGGTTKIITIGTEYQEYFVDVTYNQASTYMALCFYTSTWTGQTLTVKEFKVAKIVTPGETYSTLPTPTKTSYSFSGWFTESSGGTQVTSATVVSETASHTLYAHWNPNTIKLTLDKVGGTGGTDCIYYKYGTNKYYSDSSCTTEITTFEMPTKTGYTFIHYYGDGTKGGTSGERYLYGNVESGITPGTFADDLCTDIYADATLYASWTANIYTITLNNQGATSAGTTTIYEKYATGYYSDSSVTSGTTSITIPTKTGYTFDGYYTLAGLSGTQIINSSGTIVASNTYFTSNTTLYEKWTENFYTITLDSQNSSSVGTSRFYEKYSVGWYDNVLSTIKITSVSVATNSCENECSSFAGYYTGVNGTGTQIINSSGTILVSNTYFTSDKTLYAKWVENDFYARFDANGNPSSTGDYIEFGYYPKTIKASDVTINTSNVKNGYYLGSDGYRYAKVSANPYKSSYQFSDGTTIVSETEYYFKVEPIKWRILTTDKNGYALLFCEDIITAMCFDSERNNEYVGASYSSDIRAWLIDGFWETAFKNVEQNLIESTGGTFDTTTEMSDKIFLLSYDDMINTKYGFISSYSNEDTARVKQTTDYARANKAYYDTTSGNGIYWTRSKDTYDPSVITCVNYEGSMNDSNNYYICQPDGIRGVAPALWLNLNTITITSKCYSDDTSGHHYVVTKKCNSCGIVFKTETSEVYSHTMTTTTTYQVTMDQHCRVRTTKCSECNYSTTTTGLWTDHSYKSNGKCVCGATSSSSGGITLFSSSNNCSMELCNDQDVLLNDKKKFNELLYVDEKKYISNGYEAKNFQI